MPLVGQEGCEDLLRNGLGAGPGNGVGTKARCTRRKKRRGKYSTARREDPPRQCERP